jgi:hypothetical protein
MSKETQAFHKAGLALGLATFIISNAAANPFQAQVIKTGYVKTPSDQDIVRPNDFPGPTSEDVVQGTTSASTPHYEEAPIASDRDPFSNGAVYVIEPERPEHHDNSYCDE